MATSGSKGCGIPQLHDLHEALPAAEDTRPFIQPWDFGDVTFIIQGRKMYVNKTTLSMSSDVFKAMFSSKFKEKEMTEIPLPDKKFDDFLQLMQILHPPHTKNVDDTNAACLVPLVHEYQIHHVMERCVKTLLEQRPSIHILILAEKFSLTELRQVCIEYVKDVPYHKLEEDPEFEMINKDTLHEIYQYKLKIYESKGPYESNDPKLNQHKEPHLELIRCTLMFQKPSINNLVLAEKYGVYQVYGKCLQYLRDTQLMKLQHEPGFKDLKPETLTEVLKYKVDKLEAKVYKLEAVQTEVSNIASWDVPVQQGTCHGQGWSLRHPIGTNVKCPDCKKYRCTHGNDHNPGTNKDCSACKGNRFDEICEVVKKF